MLFATLHQPQSHLPKKQRKKKKRSWGLYESQLPCTTRYVENDQCNDALSVRMNSPLEIQF